MIKIAVGTLNPVKIQAVRDAFVSWQEDAVVEGVTVPSGVDEMPMSDGACIAGARNRAVAARLALDADFGVGLEGGVNVEASGMMLLGWVVIVNRHGVEGIACSAKLPLPKAIAQRVAAGEVLGDVMDDLLNDTNTKQKGGAIGALTVGLVSRSRSFTMAVQYALAPFLASSFYQFE